MTKNVKEMTKSVQTLATSAQEMAKSVKENDQQGRGSEIFLYEASNGLIKSKQNQSNLTIN
jgi:uncharacterized protein YoxC